MEPKGVKFLSAEYVADVGMLTEDDYYMYVTQGLCMNIAEAIYKRLMEFEIEAMHHVPSHGDITYKLEIAVISKERLNELRAIEMEYNRLISKIE